MGWLDKVTQTALDYSNFECSAYSEKSRIAAMILVVGRFCKQSLKLAL
jgi:hypothetical protein